MGHRALQRAGVAARLQHRALHLPRCPHHGGGIDRGDRRPALSVFIPHPSGQGGARGVWQSRGRGIGRHPDDAGAGFRLWSRRGARLRVGHADRNPVSLHRALRRRLSAQEFRCNGAGRSRQSRRRLDRRHSARVV
jgi:hypothetical protein